jgi:cysteine-rich repeat protein
MEVPWRHLSGFPPVRSHGTVARFTMPSSPRFRSTFPLVFTALTLAATGGCVLDLTGDPSGLGAGGRSSSSSSGATTSTGASTSAGSGGHGGGPAEPGCGDGAITAGEACDDGNAKPGDGCDAACAIEIGFDCAGEPSVCAAVCGDGITAGEEGCDDSNTDDGDGCTEACAIESGYVCSGTPSVCVTVCGDAQVLGFEVCDDGNTTAGDGCSATCTTETGFICQARAGAKSFCFPICGDDLVVTGEDCEDGNTDPGDGCSAQCTFEATCGNGVVEPGEACDPGDPASAAGCDPMCALEPGTTCGGSVNLNDPARVTITGNVTLYSGDTTGSMLVNYGAPGCGTNAINKPAVDVPTVVHRYRVGNKPAKLTVETLNVGGSLDDTIVWAYRSCFDTSAELACDDDGGPGMYSVMNVDTLPAGTTVFIAVAGYYKVDKGPYQLKITEAP